jgi:DNA transposition AAA+ family ATPase
MMDDVAASLRRYISRTGTSQQALAEQAGISQSTISRILAGQGARSGPARRRMLMFMQDRDDGGPERALDAVRSVWDGSVAHEAALVKLILASEELWPKLGEE